MRINHVDSLYDDSTYRIRCMDSLRKQLETDYDELTTLLKKRKNDTTDISKIDEALGKISWIKKGLNHIVDMRDVWYPNQYIHMAIPLLGTDNGGLNKTLVSDMIHDVLGVMDNTDIEIWRL